jgi:hypothetical protein
MIEIVSVLAILRPVFPAVARQGPWDLVSVASGAMAAGLAAGDWKGHFTTLFDAQVA